MKMAKWVLRDNNQGSVLVVRTDSPPEFGRMLLFEDTKIKFFLLTDRMTSKSVGYRLDYLDAKRPKSTTFNAFAYMAKSAPVKDPTKLHLEILYEDQVVRLLLYERPNKTKDYFLIGRWRTENLDEMDTDGFLKEAGD